MSTWNRVDSQESWYQNRFLTIGCLVLLLFISQFGAFAIGADTAQSTDLSRWTERSPDHPFDDELRLLATDVINPAYEQLLGKMISNDLDAEWLRVDTVDNYQSFLEQHGGKDKVLADPKLKKAYEVRREIAVQFVELVRRAYKKLKREPWFNEQQVDELCARTHRSKANALVAPAVPIRALMSVPAAAEEWPQFRGPTGQGLVVDASFPLRWTADENVVWKKNLPGLGNSSPIVWGQKLVLSTAAADGKKRSLSCYSTETGDLFWQYAAPAPIEPVEKLNGKNSYATSTPVTDGERVIGFFGNSGMVCCDFDGKEIWKKNLGAFVTSFGPGSSPLIYGDKVILIQDQNSGEPVCVALNKYDGVEVWRQARPAVKCWSTPLIVRCGQRDELLYNGSHVFTSFDPDTGTELWRFNGPTRETIPMPVIGGGKIYSASGRNGPMFALLPGGNGDVTETHGVWSLALGGPHVPTPMYHAGRLFMVNDMGIASCRDAETGNLIWQERMSGQFSTSILSAQDKLLVTSEAGTTHIIKAADKFEEIAVNELNEKVLATPAIVRGRIYFRTPDHLICIGNPTR